MNTIEFPSPKAFGRLGDSSGERLVARDPVSKPPAAIVHYLTIARRRKWVIIGSIAVALVLGLAATLLMTPQYTASATLEIQRETRNFTQVRGADNGEQNAMDLEFYQTQYGLLRARSLADQIAHALKLENDPHFFEMFGASEAEDWFENGRPRSSVPAQRRIRKAGDILLAHLDVQPERLSRLVQISFTSSDAEFSKRVVDAWGENFVGATLERRFEATSYARKFLEGRLAQLRARIDQAERQLVAYASRQGIITLPASTPAGDNGISGERSLTADDLATLNRELARATAARVEAESRLASSAGSTEEALQNTAISGLRERRAELAAEYAKMAVQFEPSYPPALALQNQVEALDRAIVREEERVKRTLSDTYAASRSREEVLRRQVEELKSGVLDQRRRSIQYNIIQRDADTNRQLYDALLQRYKEIGVAGGVGVNNIAVVDPAEIPLKPSSPRFLLNMFIALLAGSLLGVAIALALEQIDQGISDPAEVREALGLPLLGSIPRVAGNEPLEALQDRKSELTEAYLSLQTNLAFSTDHGVPRTLAVTSTRPAEGKTTTSFALAVSIARSNRRVLLIDADMRSPSLHRVLDVTNNVGLSNFLSGDDDLTYSLVPTIYESLTFLPAGPQPPSSPELLSSSRFDLLIETLLQSFDHLVFDMPPIMGLADAPLVGSRMEGVVFVIESHSTQRGMAQVALSRLRHANAQILGAVLTKFDTKRAHYGYGYDYGYGYSYGSKNGASG